MTQWEETTQIIRYGNCTITVHRPVLTPSEKMKREHQAQATLRGVMRDYLHRKEEKHGNR